MERRPIHERVKDHVERAGLSHAELAKLTGWDEQRVYRVLAGKTRLTAVDMELLARILDKPVASLYREARAS
jgi:transcriptional regulator with XRE-family HTH domain